MIFWLYLIQILEFISMRKNSNQVGLFPKLYSANFINEPLSSDLSTLEKYHMQFTEPNEPPLVNFRVNKRSIRHNATQPKTNQFANEIKEVSREISDLKKEIRSNRYSRKDETNSKLGRLLTEVEDSIFRNRSMPPTNFMPQTPLYVPVPFPMYMPQQNQPPYPGNNINNDSFYHRSTKRKTAIRFNRGKKNLRKWRKVANCALFYFYLKRFCKLVQFNRKLGFEKFMDTIKPHLNGMKKLITESLQEFLNIILLKREVSFDFEEGDDKDVIKEKVNSLRKLVGLVLDNLLETTRENIGRPQLIESIYFLCRHGNYSCTQLILTKEELELSCISSTFKYVSADKHLEKSALISLLLVKLLLYNMLLSPPKLGPKFTQYEIPQNLYTISSILYQFFIDFQDEQMLLVNPIYSIGNYEDVGKARVLQSIIIREGTHRQGELISGLKPEGWVKKYFKFQNWSQEKKSVKLLIELLHGAMSKFHGKFIQKYF